MRARRLLMRNAARRRNVDRHDVVNIRNFKNRSQEEQESFVSISWCDSCHASGLGMLNPVEFELNGKVYLRGECSRCKNNILSEIIQLNDSRFDGDVISPIVDKSVIANTFLYRSPFARLTPWVSICENRYGINNVKRIGIVFKIVICIFSISLIYLIFKISENPSVLWR